MDDGAYDGLGRRIQKDINGSITKYVYDNEDIVAEYSGTSTTPAATYLHGPGIDPSATLGTPPLAGLREPIYMSRGGQTYYYHADGLGSIAELTDSTGSVVQSYKYDAFGNILSQTPARRSFSEGGGTLINPFTYTGREFDSESGLLYYRARYLDPRIGRFLQEDPIGLAGGDINFYVYTKNNPVNYVDPFGKDAGVLVLVGSSSNPIGLIIVGTAIVVAVGYLVYQEYKANTCSIQYQSDRTPSKGEPDTSDVYDSGESTTERFFDDEGNADVDIDYGHDHGVGDPHYHEWDWSKKNPRQPGDSLPSQ